MQRNPIDVFISYPRSERADAERLRARLAAMGRTCFFDLSDIDSGANFPDKFDAALRQATAVLCCWSPAFFERPWCMIECRDALEREIAVPIAVKRFDRFDPPADLRHINYFDLVDWDGSTEHEGWKRTVAAIEKLLARRAAAPTSPPESNHEDAQLLEQAKQRLMRVQSRVSTSELLEEVEAGPVIASS